MTNDRKNRAARAEQMRKEREKAERRQRNIISVAIVAVVVVLVGIGGWAIMNERDKNERQTEVVQPANTTDDYGIVYQPADGSEPPEDAPVVQLYEDFLCPACGQFEAANGQQIRQLADSGDIQLVYQPYSFLDQMGGSTNEYSLRATNIAMCALDEGGHEDFNAAHDALFANQPGEGGAGPSDAEITGWLEDAGVTVDESCVRTQNFGEWVKEAQSFGQSEHGVSGTPTILIDGEPLEDRSMAGILAAIGND